MIPCLIKDTRLKKCAAKIVSNNSSFIFLYCLKIASKNDLRKNFKKGGGGDFSKSYFSVRFSL